MQQWASQGLGIRWLTLMLNDSDGGSPSAYGAETWKSFWGLDSVAVAPDPMFSLLPMGQISTPVNHVIDPRTMRIVYIQQGYSGSYSQLTSLAQSNQP